MRTRRGWSQEDLASRAGLDRNIVGRFERGEGRADLQTLERVALVFDVSFTVSLGRDPREDVADAGHLAMQELLLRLGRAAGFEVQFELATRPVEPWRSIDVAFGDPRRMVAVEVECWNTFGDIGVASRSSTRKLAELAQASIGRWGEDAKAALVWVVRDTTRNRALIARSPEVFASRFPGSSRAWVAALTAGAPIPTEPGLVWCNLRGGRLIAWRRPLRCSA